MGKEIDNEELKLTKEEITTLLVENDIILNEVRNVVDCFDQQYKYICRLTCLLDNILKNTNKRCKDCDTKQCITAPEPIVTDKISNVFKNITRLRDNAISLKNKLKTNKTYSSFWEKAFIEEMSISFNNDEMNNILSFVNDISKRDNISIEIHYKNFYNILIVLKAHRENNKSLHDNFINHLQNRYIDHWDWANKYKKEDYDMHYYGLYCECRSKIEGFINDKYKSESEAQRVLYTNTLNKYLSFLYILYNKIDKSKWEYNEEDVIKDKQQILNLKANIENIKCIKFGTEKIIATLKSKKLIKLISENFITYISKKIVFETDDKKGVQEVEYKIQIFKLLNSRKKFISAIVKASFSALKELGFEVSKTHGTKELIYDIINTIISDLLLTKQNLEEGLNAEELFDFEKSAHIKSLSRSLIKETFCLKYDDCNGTLLCKNFQPELIYTDENGKKNIITTFSDLF